MLVTLFGSQISRRFTTACVTAIAGVPMPMVMHADKRCNRALAAMRGDRPSMKAGEHESQKAKKGDKLPHEAPVSAVQWQCIAFQPFSSDDDLSGFPAPAHVAGQIAVDHVGNPRARPKVMGGGGLPDTAALYMGTTALGPRIALG